MGTEYEELKIRIGLEDAEDAYARVRAQAQQLAQAGALKFPTQELNNFNRSLDQATRMTASYIQGLAGLGRAFEVLKLWINPGYLAIGVLGYEFYRGSQALRRQAEAMQDMALSAKQAGISFGEYRNAASQFQAVGIGIDQVKSSISGLHNTIAQLTRPWSQLRVTLLEDAGPAGAAQMQDWINRLVSARTEGERFSIARVGWENVYRNALRETNSEIEARNRAAMFMNEIGVDPQFIRWMRDFSDMTAEQTRRYENLANYSGIYAGKWSEIFRNFRLMGDLFASELLTPDSPIMQGTEQLSILVKGVLDILEKIDAIVRKIPPMPKGNVFGNASQAAKRLLTPQMFGGGLFQPGAPGSPTGAAAGMGVPPDRRAIPPIQRGGAGAGALQQGLEVEKSTASTSSNTSAFRRLIDEVEDMLAGALGGGGGGAGGLAQQLGIGDIGRGPGGTTGTDGTQGTTDQGPTGPKAPTSPEEAAETIEDASKKGFIETEGGGGPTTVENAPETVADAQKAGMFDQALNLANIRNAVAGRQIHGYTTDQIAAALAGPKTGGGAGGLGGNVAGGAVVTKPGGTVDADSLYKYYVSQFRGSKLDGFIPKDGAQFGIIKGTPEEYARLALATSIQESGLRANAPRGGLNQMAASNLRDYGVTGDVNDPTAQATALSNVFKKFIPQDGVITGPGRESAGAGRYFGSIRAGWNQRGVDILSGRDSPMAQANRIATAAGAVPTGAAQAPTPVVGGGGTSGGAGATGAVPTTSPLPRGQVYPGAPTAPGAMQSATGAPQAFIVHHTGPGINTAAQLLSVLKQRGGLGVEYTQLPNGDIVQVGQPGAANIRPEDMINPKTGKTYGTELGASLKLRNQNIVGIEVMAANDAAVKDENARKLANWIQTNYPQTPVYGHGEIQSDKEPDEGQKVTRMVRAMRAGTMQSDAGAQDAKDDLLDKLIGAPPSPTVMSADEIRQARKGLDKSAAADTGGGGEKPKLTINHEDAPDGAKVETDGKVFDGFELEHTKTTTSDKRRSAQAPGSFGRGAPGATKTASPLELEGIKGNTIAKAA
jgi:hypothetical protein